MGQILMIFIPILMLRLIVLRSFGLAIIQDLAIASQLGWILQWLPTPIEKIVGFIALVYHALDAFIFCSHRLRMQVVFLVHFLDIRSFWHSIRHEKLGAFSLIVLVLLGWLFIVPSYFGFSVPILGVLAITVVAWVIQPKIPNCLLDEEVRGIKTLFSKKGQVHRDVRALSLEEKTFEIAGVETDKPHIIFLFLESFRAKDVGCLQSGQGVSPCFDALAKEGILFTQFYANEPLSFRALIASLYGKCMGADWKRLPSRSSLEGIPQLLKAVGYETAYFHNGDLEFANQRAFLHHQKFDYLIGNKDLLKIFPEATQTSWGVHDEYLMQYTLEKLKHQKDPLFLTLFTMTNHHPWTKPPSSDSSSQTIHEKFQSTMAYSDQVLGEFIQGLRDAGLTKKTVLFIMGDHGHPMGEHRELYSNLIGLYEETIHVPLLILADGRIKAPCYSDHLSSQIDLLPTIADLFGYSINCLGSSLLREKKDKQIFYRNIYENYYQGTRKGMDKYVFTRKSSQEELYDLVQDPKEEKNIYLDHPQKVEAFKNQITDFFASCEMGHDLYKDIKQDELNLRNDLHITDHTLIDLINKMVGLKKLNITHCLLVTDQGVATVLNQMPMLRELYIRGLDLTDRMCELFNGQRLSLMVLDMGDNPKITNEGIQKIFPALFHVRSLKLDCTSFTDDTFLQFGLYLGSLSLLTLEYGLHITDEGLRRLLEGCSMLNELHITNFPLLTDQVVQWLSTVKTLLTVRFICCPNITQPIGNLITF